MPPSPVLESVGSPRSDISRKSSMGDLEEVVAKLLDDPATEAAASEIGGALILSRFFSMRIIRESFAVHLRR